MIRLDPRPTTPEVLREKGAARRRSLAKRVKDGKAELAFDHAVYAHAEVKQALATWQHGKCAFCEAKCTHVTGHVEHFRPKAGWDQGDGTGLQKPGYWWLAYAWSNLLLACEACNSRHKRNLFPLRDPTKRANDEEGVGDESPVFVDPSLEDPSPFLTFHGEIPIGIDAAGRGRGTIEALGLDREALSEHRRGKLRIYERMLDVLRLHAAGGMKEGADTERIVAGFRATLRGIVDGTGEYAAMGRANLDLSLV